MSEPTDRETVPQTRSPTNHSDIYSTQNTQEDHFLFLFYCFFYPLTFDIYKRTRFGHSITVK